MIGRKFKYIKSSNRFQFYDAYDRIVGSVSYLTNDEIDYIISSTGVLYKISDIEIEPIEYIRDRKLKDLGINGN
jgi:hypothetical protein